MKIATSTRLIAETSAMRAALKRAVDKSNALLAANEGVFDTSAKPVPASTKAEQDAVSFNAFVGKHLTKYVAKGADHV